MSAFRAYLDLVRWDWVREMKRKDTIVSMVLFSLVTLMIFSMAIRSVTREQGADSSPLGLKAQIVAEAGAGILWVTFFLAGSIGVDRAFRSELQSRVLEGLLLSPIGRVTIYYARVTSTVLYVLAMEVIAFTAFAVLYSVDATPGMVFQFALGAVAATIGFVAAGITLSAMTRAIRGGEVLLRLLLFPLLIPLFNAVVSLTDTIFNAPALRAMGIPVESPLVEVTILVSFDLVYLAAGQILFEVVVSDFDG